MLYYVSLVHNKKEHNQQMWTREHMAQPPPTLLAPIITAQVIGCGGSQ